MKKHWHLRGMCELSIKRLYSASTEWMKWEHTYRTNGGFVLHFRTTTREKNCISMLNALNFTYTPFDVLKWIIIAPDHFYVLLSVTRCLYVCVCVSRNCFHTVYTSTVTNINICFHIAIIIHWSKLWIFQSSQFWGMLIKWHWNGYRSEILIKPWCSSA